VPAYCVTTSRQVPAQYALDGFTRVTGRDINGQPVAAYIPRYKYVPARTVQERVCYPARPAVNAVPPTTTYTAITGWNGGASSIASLDGDGAFEFQVGARPFGVVVGIGGQDQTTLPSEQRHAFYIHGDSVDIMEHGQVVAVGVVAHAESNTYRISRAGAMVTYTVGDWSRVSMLQSAGAVVLDASLYASGDHIDNPQLLATAVHTGHAEGQLPALSGRGGMAEYAEAFGGLPALSGEALALPWALAAGNLPSLAGVAADRPYSSVAGALPALTGSADGGFPQLSIISMVGALAPLAGIALSQTGEIGQAAGTLPALGGLAADRPYGAASGSLGAFTGMASSGWPVPNEAYFSSGLALLTLYRPDDVSSAVFASGLQLGSSFDLVPMGEAAFSSVLLLGSVWSSEYAVDGAFGSGLRIVTRMFGDRVAEEGLEALLAGQPAQYAINARTGAPTQYSGFDFGGFAQVGQALYAFRPDGVYRIRPGDDDGAPLQAFIDFGSSDYGTSQVKRLEAVYLGLDTDGETTLRLVSDSGEHAYRVERRGPMARARTAKGASGRLWNMVLEIEDATHFELDAVEAQVGASTRRLGRQR
jgi:hypothetical protein